MDTDYCLYNYYFSALGFFATVVRNRGIEGKRHCLARVDYAQTMHLACHSEYTWYVCVFVKFV